MEWAGGRPTRNGPRRVSHPDRRGLGEVDGLAEVVPPSVVAPSVPRRRRPPQWRVRLLDTAGQIVGAGVLVDGDHVLTCAHVVTKAVGTGDPTETAADRPHL